MNLILLLMCFIFHQAPHTQISKYMQIRSQVISGGYPSTELAFALWTFGSNRGTVRNSLDFPPCCLWPDPKILLRCTLAWMHVDCWLKTYIPHVIDATCLECNEPVYPNISVYLICLYVYLPIYLSTYLLVYLSIYLSIYLSVCLSVCLSTCLPVYLIGPILSYPIYLNIEYHNVSLRFPSPGQHS